MRFVLVLAFLSCFAGELKVIPMSEAVQFRMGKVISNRLIHPDMGARKLTLNYSITGPGDEFSQHVHDGCDDTIVLLEGRADLRQADSRKSFSAGQAAWVPAGQIHGTITTAPGTHMISFQTPPDMVLYTGARDSSKPGAAPPKGDVTPGAVKYINFTGKNGVFVGPGVGAKRIVASHRTLAAGQSITTELKGDAEQAVFLWKGKIAVTSDGKTATATAPSGVFARGTAKIAIRNEGPEPAVLIYAQAPPAGSK